MNVPVEAMGVVAAIVAILQLAKKVPTVAAFSEWFPFLAILLGVAGAWLVNPSGGLNNILTGIAIGLAAAGSYDAVYKVLKTEN